MGREGKAIFALAQQRSRRDVVANHCVAWTCQRERITDFLGCDQILGETRLGGYRGRGWLYGRNGTGDVAWLYLRQLSSSHSFRLFSLSHICANCPVAVIISRCCACMTPYLIRLIIRTTVLSETKIIFHTAGSPEVNSSHSHNNQRNPRYPENSRIHNDENIRRVGPVHSKHDSVPSGGEIFIPSSEYLRIPTISYAPPMGLRLWVVVLRKN